MTLTATDLDGIEGFWMRGRFYPIIAGGDGTDDSGDGDSTGGDDSGDTGDTSGGTDTGQSDAKDKTLSQDQVNAIVSREVDRAKRGKLDPKELGFDSGKELKEFIDQAKQFVEDQKSEAEKALEEAKKSAREEAVRTVLAPANERVLKAEFMLAAMENGVTLAKDAFVLAKADEDLWKTVELSEDDGVVTGLTEDFFKELKEKKPFLFGKVGEGSGTPPPPGDIGAGAQGAGGETRGPVDPGRAAELSQKYPLLERMRTAMGASSSQQSGEGS